jgi:hypothetical protein
MHAFTALAISMIPALSMASGGFWDSCKDCSLNYATMSCKCSGNWVGIDLGQGIANYGGHLGWG